MGGGVLRVQAQVSPGGVLRVQAQVSPGGVLRVQAQVSPGGVLRVQASAATQVPPEQPDRLTLVQTEILQKN